ncbi:MAG: hypothetical protein ABEI86_12555, partial [Halobacteriaceae archaeon]
MWRESYLHGDLFSETPKLGEGLLSNFPESIIQPPLTGLDEDINVNSKYVLSGKERELLKYGRVEGKWERNKATLQKRDLLPERIQHLITDVALLYHRSYFSQ